MSECTHDCSSCGENCSSREPESLLERPHEKSHVKKVIGIISGKGGVGKSMVTSVLAVSMQRKGYETGIMDADITGPSIPNMFGIKDKAQMTDVGLLPIKTESGIDVMSINLLLEKTTDPVIWRGPVIAGVVKQFWTDVIWENEDFLFVDMPPGTGDVPLTVFQSLPVDGIVIVTSPQTLVSMVVSKAVSMAQMMNIPIIGIIENMSYYQCPDCGKKHEIYGESHVQKIADKYHLNVLAKLPIDPRIAEACDEGLAESLNGDYMAELADSFENAFKALEENDFIRIAVPTDAEGSACEQFGKAPGFRFYNVEKGKLVSSVNVESAGDLNAVVKFLKGFGTNVVICGTIADEALQKLQDSDIWTITDHKGKADDLVNDFLNGDLDLHEFHCDEDHHHEGVDHDDDAKKTDATDCTGNCNTCAGCH